MIYRQTIDIPSYLCDVDDRLHTWAAVRLCQEVTEHHGNATGIGFKTLLAQGHGWVITRALYRVRRMPDAFERVKLSTWSRCNNGLQAMRDYRMESAAGDELLTGTSYWALIDLEARRVIRLGDVISHYEDHDIMATGLAELQKVKLPDMENADHVEQRQAHFGMVDHTHHVNNSEYIRFIFDVLHTAGFDTKHPFELEINYQHETRPGETLCLRHREDGGVHHLLITNPRGVSVAAQVRPC